MTRQSLESEDEHMSELSTLAATVGQLLKDRGESLAVAESSCGGLLNATLVAISGASAYYVGGAIIYTRTAQQGLLGVPDEAMEGKRASTEEYAAMNAATIRERLGTIWGLGETGASGPTGNRYGDNFGHACIAVSGPVERAITIETGDPDREGNMWVFAERALALLEECLREPLGNSPAVVPAKAGTQSLPILCIDAAVTALPGFRPSPE